MLQNDKSFSKNGYVRCNVLDDLSVKKLREEIWNIYTEKYLSKGIIKPFLNLSDLIGSENVLNLWINDKIVETLNETLEENYSFIPDLIVQINHFGLGFSGKNGWHIDANSEVPNKYLVESDYRFVKCGLYLQDNDAYYGGGIDLITGFHNRKIKTGHLKTDFRIMNVLTRLLSPIIAERLDVKSGDFVAFDSRLPHRSSPPCRELISQLTSAEIKRGIINYERMPFDNIKMVLYFNACRKKYVKHFMLHSKKRSQTEEIEKNVSSGLFFTDYLSKQYPVDFPYKFVQKMSKTKAVIARLEDQQYVERCVNYVKQNDSLR